MTFLTFRAEVSSQENIQGIYECVYSKYMYQCEQERSYCHCCDLEQEGNPQPPPFLRIQAFIHNFFPRNMLPGT